MDFESLLVRYEVPVRLSFFFGVFVLMAIWEHHAPRRVLTVSKLTRWLNNIALVFLNSIIVRLLFPAAAVGVASYAAQHQWGLLHQFPIDFPFAVLLSIVVLDFVIYLQHVMLHAVPLLWRLHRVHHADLDYDVSTGARFHPFEIILSMLLKFAAIVVIGPPVIAVIIFEVLLNGLSMFNHGNVELPKKLDALLRLLVVTPDMHRVHHSIEENEANSNFGFNLSCWDRLFGTYRAQPRQGHIKMTVGIRKHRSLKQVTGLPGILLLPFVGKVSDYALNRRQWRDDSEK